MLCLTVFDVFQESCPTMVMTPEQLFADASHVLDTILCAKEDPEDYCKRLWTNVINEYHAQDMTAGDTNITTKVAMVFYAVMYALQAVNNSHYRGTLQNLLHDIIWDYFGKTKGSITNRCLDIERKLKPKVNLYSQDMFAWMEEYFSSTTSLSKEIATLFARKKNSNNKKTNGGAKIENPTINYTCSSKDKSKRIDKVMKLLIHWGDIDVSQEVNHFQDAFSGNDLKLNIKWNGDSTFLYFMVQEILKQPFVQKQKTGSAMAIATNIYGSKPNANKNRYTEASQRKTEIIIYVLNPRNPELALTKNGAITPDSPEGYDDAYIAEQVAKAGALSIIKDLNKNYD